MNLKKSYQNRKEIQNFGKVYLTRYVRITKNLKTHRKIINRPSGLGELKMTALEVLKIADWQTLALLGGAVLITAIVIYYIIIGRIDI